jgi:predicted permease
VDLGFQPTNVTTFNLSLPEEKYDSTAKVRRFASTLLERLRALPGVQESGLVFGLPLAGVEFTIAIHSISGHPLPEPGQAPASLIRPASPGYFSAMRIPVVRGRLFTEQDRWRSAQVMVINEAAARRFFPGEDPIGRTLLIGWTEDSVRMGGEIVGIAGDVRSGGLKEAPEPELYLPFDQAAVRDFTVVMQATGSPSALLSAARRVVQELDRDLPLFQVKTMEERVGAAAAQPRFYTVLLAIFAGVALLLAAVGVYGVMSYSVSQRAPEIGIRMALGARSSDVLRLVLGQGMALAILGLALGVSGALASGRVLQSLLFGVSSSDLTTFVGVSVVLGTVALLASYLPARRAARTDPMEALRQG